MNRTSSARNRARAISGLFFALVASGFAEGCLRFFSDESGPLLSTGRISIVFLALFTIYYGASLSLTGFRENLKDLLSLTLVTAGSICIISLFRLLAVSMVRYQGGDTFFGEIHPESLYLAIPFASGALIVQAILGMHYALVLSIVLSMLMAVYAGNDVVLIPFTFVTCVVGGLSLTRFRSRSAYIKGALNITVVALAFALASLCIMKNLTLTDGVAIIGGGVAGGAVCIFIAAGITPLFEYLGGYVTDMRLIEMATLDHPLLKELSIQTPGTWNHSMVMGMMAEQAADAVGANPVVARVGAYFHDIGKIKKPGYFVENQGSGENKHEKLSPSMSALIIRSHVKDGIELGRQHRLPEAIIDMIPQHHGTSLIEYFYDKAAKEGESSGEEPDPSLYSYPGPRPQTKEAGILMLADGIEAAARTLNEPDRDRIRGLVQKMINRAFRSGQLNDCELTLKELHIIAKCFTRVLAGIYHQRIAYAEPAEKVNILAEETDPEATSAEIIEDEEEEEEDLRRLGQDHEH